jgi:5'-nucleotidase
MKRAEVHPLKPSPLVVGISSRALFDLDESHRVFEERGVDEYRAYQVRHENDALRPGVAFPLVKKLLRLNEDAVDHPGVEVILMSRNSADTGLRIFNTIEHHGVKIERAVFTSGGGRNRYLAAFGVHLFLSTHAEDVRNTLSAGHAAALILPGVAGRPDSGQLRIAFDGDAVLFGDESERIYQTHGLEAFAEHERRTADLPLSGGPFKPVLQTLHQIQSAYPAEDNPIHTALVTARSAPAHKRVILTLREWGIRIDEALFLGGKPKGPFLEAFGADIFFDDQQVHCVSAQRVVATGHVPHGAANES